MYFNAMEDLGHGLRGSEVQSWPLQAKLRKRPLLPVGLVLIQLKPEKGSTSRSSLLLVGAI